MIDYQSMVEKDAQTTSWLRLNRVYYHAAEVSRFTCLKLANFLHLTSSVKMCILCWSN